MWLEPPTVCRWETPDETKISEQLEKSNVLTDKLTKKKMKSPIKSLKCVNDFDLLNMPSKIDLYSLFQEFVVPRLPNGYTMKMRRPNSSRRRSSSLKGSRSLLCHFCRVKIKNLFLVSNFVGLIAADFEPSIRNSLQSTNSPRPLYPRATTVNQNLQLITKTDENVDQQVPKTYLFSKLLQDLDELSQLQEPFVEKQLDEISETLSVISNPIEDEQETDVEFGLSFPWSIKKEEIVEQHSDSESEDSMDESVDHVSR